MQLQHIEGHRVGVGGWLRAAVLGANDGVVSVASLVVGVAAADAPKSTILTAGIAGLVGGALSMAVGEYVSVSSQRDVEEADLAKERRELRDEPEAELAELTTILEAKGMSPETAHSAAVELTQHDALAAHAAEELGLRLDQLAQPVQAAVVSAIAFACGAALPLAAIAVSRPASAVGRRRWRRSSCSPPWARGAHIWAERHVERAAIRVVVGGAAAMALTALIGRLFGAAVG